MNHIFQNSNFGQNWFTYPNLYKSMVDRFPSGSKFVEVGCWKGKSSSYMAVEIVNSGKNIDFYCVDHWLGSEEHYLEFDSNSHTRELQLKHYEPNIFKLYEIFTENMKPVENYYIPLKMNSVEASNHFKNKSLDFVFIDASHDYESVKSDIQHWLPKLKSNGILSGHDISFDPVKNAVSELLCNFEIDVEQDCWIYTVN